MNMTASRIDLHMHSTASDGILSPSDLVELASQNQVEVMALTDHDTVDGLAEAREKAQQKGMTLINGVELSVTWEKKVLHVIGLDIDPGHPALVTGLENLKQQRQLRSEKIAKKLQGAGIPGAMEGAREQAGNSSITRPHFARFLVEQGHAKDIQDAFNRYLGRNKRAYVSTQWPALEDALGWIGQAGGVSVLAHPLRYKLTASWLRRLMNSFKEAGGDAIEVISGNYTTEEISTSTGYALRYDLMGSVGSDYHGHSRYCNQPGNLTPLSPSIIPIWSKLGIDQAG